MDENGELNEHDFGAGSWEEVTFEWKRLTDCIFGIIAGFGLGLCAVDQGWISLAGH